MSINLIPRRSRLDIIIGVLRGAVDRSISKTQLMGISNTGYARSRFIIEHLVKLGYMERHKKKRLRGKFSKWYYYRTTKKGLELLKAYDKVIFGVKDVLSDWNGRLG